MNHTRLDVWTMALRVLTCTQPSIDQPIIVRQRRLTLPWLTLMKRKGHPLTFTAPHIYSRVGPVPCKMYLSRRRAFTMEGTRLWTGHSLINKSNEGHRVQQVLKTFVSRSWRGRSYRGRQTWPALSQSGELQGETNMWFIVCLTRHCTETALQVQPSQTI
jgi:hypothetical protein